MPPTGKVQITYPINKSNGLPANVPIIAQRVNDPSGKSYPIWGAGMYDFEIGSYEFVYSMYLKTVLVGFANVSPDKPTHMKLWLAALQIISEPLNILKGEHISIEYQNPADKDMTISDVVGFYVLPTMPPGVTVTTTKHHIITSLSVTVSIKAPAASGPNSFYQKKLSGANINPLMVSGFYTWDITK